MPANVSPAPVSVAWDSAPVRTQYADCRIVFDGVATVGAKRYRVNVSATRGARKPEIVLRHVGGAKGGQALPESQLLEIRAAVLEAATLHLKPMRDAVIAACREGRESEIISPVDPAPELESGLIDPMGELRGTGLIVPAKPAPARDTIQTDASGRQFIDMTPTWEEIAPTLALLSREGDAKGRKYGLEEMRRMGRLADSVKALREALGALAAVANETAHCVPDGMAKDELSAAIVAAFGVLNGERA